jgi:hypothetical protein
MIPSLLVIMGARMRGADDRNEGLFSYVNLEDRVPARHPLRLIRAIVNDALTRLDSAFAVSTLRKDGPRLRRSGCFGRH